MKSLKSLLMLAVAAMTVTGCSKDEAENIAPAENTKEVTLYLTSEKPEVADETRTVYSNGSILWAGEEKVRVTYANNGVMDQENTFYITSAATLSEDNKKATFAFTGTVPTEDGAYDIYALYPSTAANATALTYAESVTAKVATPQNPTATSFDAAGDLMIGKSTATLTKFADGDKVDMAYTRLVSHGHVTLKNLPFEEGETISKVTFTAPEGTPVAGSIRVDLLQQIISYTTNSSNEIVLNYENATQTNGNFDAWFCSIPFVVSEGQDFTVAVETSRGTYTRTIQARAEGISFLQNTHCPLGINMASATFTAKKEVAWVDGDYVIAEYKDNKYYAMSVDANGTSSRRDMVEITYDGSADLIEISNEKLIWTITKTTDGNFNIQHGNQYLYAENGNSANLRDTAYDFEIVDNGDGTYEICSIGTTDERHLAINGSLGFAFYKVSSTSYSGIKYLIPAKDTRTQLDAPETVTAELKAETENTATVTWSEVTNAGSYIVTYTYTDTATSEEVAKTVTVEAPTTSVDIKNLQYETEYSFSVVATGSGYINSAATKASTTVTTLAKPEGGTTKEYTVTILPTDFTTTSYADNNKDHTFVATATDASTMDVVINTYQIYQSSSSMQWQKNKGVMYNKTDLGQINSIVVTSSEGSYTVYEGTSTEPTTTVTGSNGTYDFSAGNGFFKINAGVKVLATSIVITFTK